MMQWENNVSKKITYSNDSVHLLQNSKMTVNLGGYLTSTFSDRYVLAEPNYIIIIKQNLPKP